MLSSAIVWLTYYFIAAPVWWAAGQMSGRLVPEYSLRYVALNVAFTLLIALAGGELLAHREPLRLALISLQSLFASA